MDVTMLLCDGAAESGGKLYVLGGGWSIVRQPRVPTQMALAIKMAIPWDETNRPHSIQAVLIDEDGSAVVPLGGDQPIQVDGEVEVGRPPGLKPGTPIDAPFVLNFGPIALEPGGYVWELKVDDETVAREPFRVMESN
jgi:hypothetical protein